MLSWVDYYGGDIMQSDKIEKAKIEIEERHQEERVNLLVKK